MIVENSVLVVNHWGPKLRYRAIEPTREQWSAVRGAADWFVKHYGSL